ncbi:MAG: hypothetical protein ACREQ9_16260 [Candidatus Binatia bacterium]
MKNDAEVEALRVRLEALESESRRWRGILVAAVAALAAPLLVGASRGGAALEAERFVLRDHAGEMRGLWSLSPEGDVEMSIRDAAGGERLRLAVAGDGRPSIELRDAESRPRVRLVLARESSLNFYDRATRLRAALGVTSYGPTPLRLRPGGLWSPLRAIRDFFGGAAPEPLAAPDGEPPPPNEEDGPVLKFYDPAGKPRLEARVDGELPFVFLHTPQGTIERVQTEKAEEPRP